MSETLKIKKAEAYACSRSGARQLGHVIDGRMVNRWHGSLGGRLVRLTTHPDKGYLDRICAVKAAQEFKTFCKQFIKDELPVSEGE